MGHVHPDDGGAARVTAREGADGGSGVITWVVDLATYQSGPVAATREAAENISLTVDGGGVWRLHGAREGSSYMLFTAGDVVYSILRN